MRITFHGAARQVTGSAHELEVGTTRVLLDCGSLDYDRSGPDNPNRMFRFDPRGLDAVVVSHAHNDHIGRLPILMKAGYDGPVYMTAPTAEIAGQMLRDSARIQREDARMAAQRSMDPPRGEVLFEPHDVEALMLNVRTLPYRTTVPISPAVSLTYHDAGHILGSAMMQLDCRENGHSCRLAFTGDLGRRNMALLPDPATIRDIDVLVSESTYGSRTLDSNTTLMKQLHAIVARATRLRSRIIIPAFSLGRTQRMVYCFQELFNIHKVKPIPVYVDSPLATRLTAIHRDYPEAYTRAARRAMGSDEDLFQASFVEYCVTWDESRRLNHLDGPLIIIASSGMCEAGRVRHHLRHAIEDPDNAVVIVSYQSEGTIGRQISDGADQIKILDQWYDLNAAVYVLDGFSGHADRDDLAWWYEKTGGKIGAAFLVHGEPESMEALAPVLQPHVTSPVVIPEIGQSFEL